MARCFFGSRAIAARTCPARSPRSTASVALSACDAIRSSLAASSGSSASGFGVFAPTLFRQTLTPIRYSQVPSEACPLKFFEAAIGADEDVLRQIARVFVVADEAIAQLIDVALVPLDEDVERFPPPREARLDQLGVRRVRHRHLTAGLGRRCHVQRDHARVVSMPHTVRPRGEGEG